MVSPLTPGPWIVDRARVLAIDHGHRFTVADCFNAKLTAEGMRANAHLVKAAPEMLTALRKLAAELDGGLHRQSEGFGMARDILRELDEAP